MDCKPSVGMRFAIIGRLFKKHLDAAGRDNDLTGVQLMVLSRLHHMESRGISHIRQRDLELDARLGHPTMTELLKKLEKKGFICCSVSPVDRRSKVISSTGKAHQLRGELEKIEQELFEKLCDNVDVHERQLLLSILDRMLENAFDQTRKDARDLDD